MIVIWNKAARRVSCESESWRQTCNFCNSKYAKVAEQRFEKAEDIVEKTQEQLYVTNKLCLNRSVVAIINLLIINQLTDLFGIALGEMLIVIYPWGEYCGYTFALRTFE